MSALPAPDESFEDGVCLTSPYSLAGITGVGRFVEMLAGEFQTRKVHTEVIYPRPSVAVPIVANRPLPLKSLLGKDVELAVRTAGQLVRDRRRFVVIHAQQAHLQSVASVLVARFLGKASLITIHARVSAPVSRLKQWLHFAVERWSLAFAGAVVFVGPFVATDFRQSEPIVIQNGIDVKAFRPSAAARRTVREALGLADEFVFAFSGRWSHLKGIDLLMTAMESPRLRGRDYRVLLLGDYAPGEPDLLGQPLNRPEIRSKLVLVTRAPDVASHLAAADVFVLPSRAEGMSLALLEAMAVGLPVLVSDLPVHRTLVEQYGCGWVFRTEDPDDLARVMASVVDQERHGEIGNRARQAVVAHHALDQMASQYLGLYRTLVSHR